MFRPTKRLLLSSTSLVRSRVPHPSLHLSEAVQKALAASSTKAQLPVVALESTIITHGLPYPLNLQVATELEETVRQAGATPATVALLDGRPMVGLEAADLERLAACAKDPYNNPAIKASRRDLSYVLSQGPGSIGGTTVSGTMVLAEMAAIPIFATGGIGGVHRGAESSMDISADLTELGRTPVSVFCSGPKSILDIPRTLEVLETQGVSVQTFNSTGEFPAFYTSTSGIYVPYTGGIQAAARSIQTHHDLLPLESGQLFGVPIPQSYDAIGQKIQQMVQVVIRESVEKGIDQSGKQVTPWLLKRLAELIPESKTSNRALVVNNAKVAAEVAVELHRLRSDRPLAKSTYSLGGLDSTSIRNGVKQTTQSLELDEAAIMIFGTAAVDITSYLNTSSSNHDSEVTRTTFPGTVKVTMGGVARNITEACHGILSSTTLPIETASQVQLVSAIGTDSLGKLLLDDLNHKRIRTDGILIQNHFDTAVCCLNVDEKSKDLISGVSDMKISQHTLLNFPFSSDDEKTKIVTMDGNVGSLGIESILQQFERKNSHPPVWTIFEPTSLIKSINVLEAIKQRRNHSDNGNGNCTVTLATPNRIELERMYQFAISNNLLHDDKKQDCIDIDIQIMATRMIQAKLFHHLFVTLGNQGVVSFISSSSNQLHSNITVTYHSSLPITTHFKNTTGAGDSFVGGIVAALYLILQQRSSSSTLQGFHLSPSQVNTLVQVGQLASIQSLLSPHAVGSQLHLVLDKVVVSL